MTDEKLKICIYCKAEIPEIAIQCRNCGHDVRPVLHKELSKDYSGPLFGVLLIVGFFLPWVNLDSSYWVTTKAFNGVNFFSSTSSVYGEGHPVIIPIISFISIFFTIILYFNESKRGEENYLLRGFSTLFSGLPMLLYFLLLLISVIDRSGLSGGNWSFGFYLSFLCSIILVFSGISRILISKKLKK